MAIGTDTNYLRSFAAENGASAKGEMGEGSEGIAAIEIAKTTAPAPVKRTMSVRARRKIAAAQRARWAKLRLGQKKAA